MSTPTPALFPNSLKNQLTSLFENAFEQAGGSRDFGRVVPSQKPELGDFQCNGAMPAAKALKKNPRKIAQGILDAIDAPSLVQETNLAGPGFINVRLKDDFLANLVETATHDERLSLEQTADPKNIILDFGGPNVAKPMHVGHLRSTIIGDSLQRLFKFLGHHILSDIHLGDWGTQMGMLIEAVKREYPDLPYFDENFSGDYPTESPVTIADLQRLYPQASNLCKENAEELEKAQLATAALQGGNTGYLALWRHFVKVSIAELKIDFGALNVEFDQWFGESNYHEAIAPMIAKFKANGSTVQNDGAWIIPVELESDKKEVPPLMLVKSDGGFLYATTDLTTIQDRIETYNADMIFYVVDKRQSLHFEQVFRAAHQTGLARETTSLEHLPFGTMNGPDGKPFKTRAGGVMRLADLIKLMTDEAMNRMVENGIAEEYDDQTRSDIAQRVGLASLKYADLQNLRTSDYIFDPVKFTRFEGRTGAYLCYAAVRIKSILRNAEGKGLMPGKIIAARESAERALQMQLAVLPDAISIAAESRMPHHLCAWAYDTAQTFNQFYTQCHILSEEDKERQAAWLGLAAATLKHMEFVLNLLNIQTPERM